MSYKFFTTRFGHDAVEKIVELRAEFPKCTYAGGMCKGTRGIFAFASNDVKKYEESYLLDNGDLFFAPTPENAIKLKEIISNYKSNWEERIPVKLKCGLTIEIFPASAIPEKVFLSLRKKTTQETESYNTSNPYGKLAYELYFKSQKGENISFKDEDFLKFIRMSLKESYVLPMEVLDSLEIISTGDLDPIFAAAMGYNYDALVDSLPKSNGQK